MTTIALTSLPVADSWNMHGGWGWGWIVPMMLGMALFWGAIILGFVWLVRDGVERRTASASTAASQAAAAATRTRAATLATATRAEAALQRTAAIAPPAN